ncbi:MAG: DnaK suppressor protein [Parcubacteria group bacterium Gr01-1014_30]|nr:MAG: DnaK suppressor protein [Parcubacteria group bacterium Gr01-1014_30]
MDKDFINRSKEKLEALKSTIEKELQVFATKDKNLKDDWDTKFPKFNGSSGGQMMEDEAEEVTEYASRLPVEYSLETRLGNINAALEKIKKGRYGKCEKCGGDISQKRLQVIPEAKTCLKCD